MRGSKLINMLYETTSDPWQLVAFHHHLQQLAGVGGEVQVGVGVGTGVEDGAPSWAQVQLEPFLHLLPHWAR